MDLYFLNDSFGLTDGPVDGFTSVVWSERYFETGTFTLHFPRAMYARLADAAFVRTAESDGQILCGRIDYRGIGEDGDCELSGRLLEAILDERLLVGRGTASGTVTDCVRTVLTDALGDDIVLGEPLLSIPDEVTLSYDWESVSDWLRRVLRPYGASFRLRLEEVDNTLVPVLRLIRGLDRTVGNEGGADPAVFSAAFGNLAAIEVERSTAKCANAVYVEGGDGTVVLVDHAGDGIRRETHKKSALSPDDFDSQADYEAALARIGEEELAAIPDGLSVTAECLATALPLYGRDYALGDVCDVFDDGVGISLPMRLTEADTVWENGAVEVFPTFGERASRGGRTTV